MDIRNEVPADPDSAAAQVVGLAQHWKSCELAAHSHQRHQLIFSVSGVMTVMTPAGIWVLPPSRAIWIQAGTEHNFIAKGSVAINILYVSADRRFVPKWDDCTVVNVSPLIRELIATAVTLPWDYSIDSREARLIDCLLEYMSELTHAPVDLPEPVDPRGKRVALILRSNFAQRITLQELSGIVGASPRTIERIFLVDTGLSFGDWRNKNMLLFALEQLAGGRSVVEVAEAVGYENPSSFIAAFRKIFGTTPRKYFMKID